MGAISFQELLRANRPVPRKTSKKAKTAGT
jgi:hypothetical protein